MRRSRRVPVVLVAVAATCACAEPLEFADWTFPLTEGTPVIGYAAVTMEERAGKFIVLEEDLAVGDDPDDPHSRFYRANGMAVDAQGRSYVLDAGNTRVQVFDANGSFVRSLGAAGEGPGEFTRPRRIAVAGDRLVVFDQGNRRFSTWDLDGTYLADHHIGKSFVSRAMAGFEDGVVVSLAEISGLDGRQRHVIEGYDLEGAPLSRFLEVEGWGTFGNTADGRRRIEPDALFPAFAVDPQGTVYLTPIDEYQILAADFGGRPKWALRVAWKRERYPQEFLDRQLESLSEGIPGAEIVVQEVRNAIVRIFVDGHGHLYVVPSVDLDTRRALAGAQSSAPFAVDVYSADGEQVFSGLLDGPLWDASLGDHVYRVGHNDDGEQKLLRYRLVEPF